MRACSDRLTVVEMIDRRRTRGATRWHFALVAVAAVTSVLAYPSGALGGAQEAELPTCRGKLATIVGTDGDDTLIGTDGPDVIAALDGRDVVRGLAGDDTICGGPGGDKIWAGEGDDYVHGGTTLDDRDTIRGGPGDDWLEGGTRSDDVLGGAGDDRLFEGPGFGTLVGGDGYDQCRGSHYVDDCETNRDKDPHGLDLGETLTIGEEGTTHGPTRQSANGQYDLTMSPDGNVQLWFGERVLWETGTAGYPNAWAQMSDSFYVICCSGVATEKIWETPVSGNHKAYLKVLDNANVVMFNALNKPLWMTGTVNSRLAGGETLGGGHFLESPNRHYRLTMAPSGELTATVKSRVLWSSGTSGNPGATLEMGLDGELGIYAAGGELLWSAGTSGNPGAVARFTKDGRLTVATESGNLLWAASDANNVVAGGEGLVRYWAIRSPSSEYRLVMQGDGDLTLRHKGTPVWSTDTAGNPRARLEMQAGGNLVLHRRGTVLWSTDTGDNPGATFELGDDGNLAVIDSDGNILWGLNS